MRKGRRLEVDQDVLEGIVALGGTGMGGVEIHQSLTGIGEFQDRVPHVRTIQRILKRLRPEGGPEMLDAPFQWHKMASYGIPWEASGLIMSLLFEVHQENDRIVAIDRSIEHYQISPPPVGFELDNEDRAQVRDFLSVFGVVSVRDVQWFWRVRQAAPEVGSSVGDALSLWRLATRFSWREFTRDVLDMPLDMKDLDSLLIYKPWRDQERHELYHRAVEFGIVPAIEESDVTFDAGEKAAGFFSASSGGSHRGRWLLRAARLKSHYPGHPEFFFLREKHLLHLEYKKAALST